VNITPSGYKFACNGYLIRHRGDRDGYALRTWEFDAKDGEGGEWQLLRAHNIDNSVQNSANSIAKFNIEGPNTKKLFTHFRIRMTGVCSSSNYWLVIQNLELYGVVVKAKKD